MQRIAKSHKVSFEQFQANWADTFPDTLAERIRKIYEDTGLPRHAMSGSAGCDFFTPMTVDLKPRETLKIPTGVCAQMEEGWVFQISPRSSLGFEFRLQLNNTVGIIDSNYFYLDNQGHMFAKMTNDTNEGRTVELSAGTGFTQGIFLPFGITVDDDYRNSHSDGSGGTDTRQVNMINRGRRGDYSGRRPQENGYHQGAGEPGSNAKRRKRRRIRVMEAVTTWAVCVLLIGLTTVGTFRVVSSVASSKKRQMRQEGTQKMVLGDCTGAIEGLDMALEKSDERSRGFNSDVLMYRAEAEYKLQDYEASIHTHDLFLEMEPSTTFYLYAQSMCHSQMGNTENATAKYQAGVTLEKDIKASTEKMEALMAAGRAYVDVKEYEKAMDFYQDTLKEGMKHGQIYNQMSLYQAAEEDHQGTLDSFGQGYETLMTRYKLGTGTSAVQTAIALPEDASPDMALSRELACNRAVTYEYLNQHQETLELLEEHVTAFNSNEDVEYETVFLKTR